MQDLERQVRLRLGLPSVGSVTERDDLDGVADLSRYDPFTKRLRSSSRDDKRGCDHSTERGVCAPEEVLGKVEQEKELRNNNMRGNTTLQKDNCTATNFKDLEEFKDLGEKTQLLLHLNKLGRIDF